MIELCSRAPLSVRELGALLNRTEAYISDAIQPLLAAGRLSFMYPDQPRHPRQRYLAPWVDGGRRGDTLEGEADERFRPPAEPAEEVPRAIEPPAVEATTPVFSSAPVFETTKRAPAASEGVGTPSNNERSMEPDEPPIPDRAERSVLNAWTSPVLSGVVGLVLGLKQVSPWAVYGGVAAMLITALHLVTGSAQIRRYRTLNSSRSSTMGFFVLKSLVAFVEIALVYVIASYLLNAR